MHVQDFGKVCTLILNVFFVNVLVFTHRVQHYLVLCSTLLCTRVQGV